MAKNSKQNVQIDRRAGGEHRKATADRREGNTAVAVERRKSQRRKTPRRRQIDPTTCERDYTEEEIEFMQALDVYKRTSGRMFPTCSEILEVIRSMGYERVSDGSSQPRVSDGDISDGDISDGDISEAVAAESPAGLSD